MIIRAKQLEKETLLGIVGAETLLLVIFLFLVLRACTFASTPVVETLSLQTESSVEQDLLIAQAEDRIAKEDYHGGLALLDVTIQASEPNARVFSARAAAYAHIGDTVHAIADYQQAIALNPDNGDYHLSLCVVAAQAGDLTTATPECDAAIRLMPNNLMAWSNRCYIRAYFGTDYSGAISDCTQATLLNANHPFPYNNRSRAYLMMGNYEQAIADATRSIELSNPYAYLPLTNRGTAYAALGDANAAMTDYQAAIEANPDYDEVYARLGEVYRWQNRPALALQSYCRYLELDTTPIQFIQDRATELGSCQ
jgi:tetratricopeptide (TPR) repeat protein